MIKVKFNNTNQFIDVEFSRVDQNVVQLLGNVPASTVGFTAWRVNSKKQLGDFSNFTTIYRVLDNGIQFSNDGSVYVEPIPIEPVVPTEEQIKCQLLSAVDNYLNTTVQTRGYDSILSACSYVNSTDEIFKAEGEQCLAWRDKVYRKCYDILADVESGKREIPSVEGLLDELPKLEW